jgi:hypothetical protein
VLGEQGAAERAGAGPVRKKARGLPPSEMNDPPCPPFTRHGASISPRSTATALPPLGLACFPAMATAQAIATAQAMALDQATAAASPRPRPSSSSTPPLSTAAARGRDGVVGGGPGGDGRLCHGALARTLVKPSRVASIAITASTSTLRESLASLHSELLQAVARSDLSAVRQLLTRAGAAPGSLFLDCLAGSSRCGGVSSGHEILRRARRTRGAERVGHLTELLRVPHEPGSVLFDSVVRGGSFVLPPPALHLRPLHALCVAAPTHPPPPRTLVHPPPSALCPPSCARGETDICLGRPPLPAV